ncbi:MAG: contractile injection system tape measure protein [Cyclobacteriaceae bacterium]
MKPSTHHIKSKVFEVSFNNEAEGLNFQKSFSDFIRTELVEITEKCLSSFDSSTLKVINKLELDLGDIPYEGYKKILAQRYEEALIHSLFNKLEFEGPDKEEGEDSPASIIFMIRHFLIRGYMPWNYNEESWDSFNQMFDHAFSLDSKLLVSELNELLTSSTARTRLIHQIEEETIQRLVKHIEPSQSDLILEYQRKWVDTGKKTSFARVASAQNARSFWLFIFNYLYEERGSYFNTRSFLLYTLQQIANHFNLSHQEVLDQLRSVHKEISSTRFSDLHRIIDEIVGQEAVENGLRNQKLRDRNEEEELVLEDIRFYLKNSKWSSKKKISTSFDEAFNLILIKDEEGMLNLLQKESKDLGRLNKLLSLISLESRYLLFQKMEPYSGRFVQEYDRIFYELAKQSVFNGINSEVKISSLLVQTLFENRSEVFNHESFLKNLLRKISEDVGTDFTSVLVSLNEIAKQRNEIHDSQVLKFLSRFITNELNEKSKEKTLLKVDELDFSLIEESIISGKIHPVLEREGYLSIRELLKFLARSDAKALNAFIQQRISKGKFIERLAHILDARLFEEIRPSHTSSDRKWIALFKAIETQQTISLTNAAPMREALRIVILTWSYQASSPDMDQLESSLLDLSRVFSLDFNLFLRSLQKLTSDAGASDMLEKVDEIAKKLGISSKLDEHVSIKINEQKAETEDSMLDQQLSIILAAINGILNREALELLGFRSADELLKHLMKHHFSFLKEKISTLVNSGQPFLGIGRDVPLSTYYALLASLDGYAGKQVTALLRRMEIQLNEGAQSINRFLSISRSLALVRLSQPTFKASQFINEFVVLIRSSSPAIYTQIIPILSKNISTISLPAKGDTKEVIENLEEQLNRMDDFSFQMDEQVLEKLITDEFFGQQLEKEATIHPYFEESTDVVYDEIYIENAGLVILSSYFGILFEKFSLLEKGKFLSDEKQEMAVLLLQHLMMKGPPLNEHHLPLNKVLCGVEIDRPIRTDIHLSKKDREIVDGLIEAVIGYWSAIGHSTVEGFQGSWLWRKGKLEHKTECWELKVEQNSYDMLLDRLPFTLSPIKLSWMSKPLIVEWR